MDMITLVNLIGEGSYNVWIVLFFTILYSVMGHMLLYQFEEKRKELKIEANQDPLELTESEITTHTILLRGLNPDIPLKEAEDKLAKMFTDLIGDEFLNVHVVGSYNKTFKLV